MVEVEAYLLQDGRFPTRAPITNIDVYWIVRARAPGSEAKYVGLNQQRPLPVERILDEACADLRTHGSDFLRGEMDLVEEVRRLTRAAVRGQGVAGIDWWAASGAEPIDT
jgi:hypothetical protein